MWKSSVIVTSVVAALVAGVAAAAAVDSTTSTKPAIDRSTPLVGYEALLGAIDRGDSAAVADSVLNPVDLNPADAALLAQRLIVGTRLATAIQRRFGERAAVRAVAYGGLAAVPRFDAAALKFDQDPRLPPERNPKVTARAVARPDQTRWLFMACAGDAWQLDRSHMSIDELAVLIQDAPWHNSFLNDKLNKLNAGTFADEKAILAALLPQPSATTTGPTDRSSPANVYAAIDAAIAAGDADAAVDCYDPVDPDQARQIRADVLLKVTFAKLTAALVQRFGPEQGQRTAESCLLTSRIRRDHTEDRWSVDGDEARECSGNRYKPASLVRRGNVWRLKLPPDHVMSATGAVVDAVDRDREAMFANRQRIAADVLAHPDKYPTPTDIMNALEPVRAEYAHRDHKAEAARQHAQQAAALEEGKKQYAATQASLSPKQRTLAEIGLSFGQQMLQSPTGTGFSDSMYYAQNDTNGSYIRARLARRAAAGELAAAADGNISSAAEQILYWFKLIDVADDVESMGMIEWSADGNVATGKPPNNLTFWTPKLRKVGKDWKIDVSDEAKGDPAAAAARADAETHSIQAVTAQVKSLKLKTLDQVTEKLRAAKILGTDETYK